MIVPWLLGFCAKSSSCLLSQYSALRTYLIGEPLAGLDSKDQVASCSISGQVVFCCMVSSLSISYSTICKEYILRWIARAIRQAIILSLEKLGTSLLNLFFSSASSLAAMMLSIRDFPFVNRLNVHSINSLLSLSVSFALN